MATRPAESPGTELLGEKLKSWGVPPDDLRVDAVRRRMAKIQLSIEDQFWLLETAELIAAAEKAKAAWNPKAKASQDLRLYKIVTAAARLIKEIGAVCPPPWTGERARLGAFVAEMAAFPERIWKAIQSLGEAPAEVAQVAEPATLEPAPEAPEAMSQEVAAEQDTALPQEVREPAAQPEAALETPTVASVDAPVADVAPAETAPKAKPTPAKKAPKAPKVAETPKAESGPREGSKTAQVVAMLKRENGATLAEIMATMGWQKHTVRGFMAGAMKKAGYTVESFKPEGGERTYRISK
jgi:hypothetical protein